MKDWFFVGVVLPVAAAVIAADVLTLRLRIWNWIRKNKNNNLIDDIRINKNNAKSYHMKTIEFHYAISCTIGIVFIITTFFLDLRSNSSGLVESLVWTCLTAFPTCILALWGITYLYNKYWYSLTGRGGHFAGPMPLILWLKTQWLNIWNFLGVLGYEFEKLLVNSHGGNSKSPSQKKGSSGNKTKRRL